MKLEFPLRPGGVRAYQDWKAANKKPSSDSWLKALAQIRKKYPLDISKTQKWPSYRSKLKEKRAKLYQGLKADAYVIKQLLDTFLSTNNLLVKLDEKLLDYCQRNADNNKLKLAALIWFADGKVDAKGNMPDGGRPTLLLDMQANGSCSAAHIHWRQVLSDFLFEQESTDKGDCVISGKQDTSIITDTFPAVKCDHLGDVKLFSRKKETPTYQRYGKEGAASMAVSAALADEMASALRYLNEKERGTTRDVVPGETGVGDLLITFCRQLPDVEPVRLLTHNAEPLDDEDAYEVEAEQICKAFKGKDNTLMAQVDFLIIRKINDGVQKAIFSSSQSLANLEAGAKHWTRACHNTPEIKLALFKKGDKTPRFTKPKSISPKQFSILFKKHYTQDIGNKTPEVPGLPFAEAMQLFLYEIPNVNLATRLLQRLLKQFSNLLVKAALKQTKPIKHHQDALYVITAIGLLLHKAGRKKELYMSELAYKLGQFFSALDEIHIGYCSSECNGQIPPRLIGNQAYATAVTNPAKALEITAQRSAVYQAWAKRTSEKADEKISDKKVKNAKYAYRWLRKHCADLHLLAPQLIQPPSTTDKAELLLGYMAGRPFAGSNNNSENSNNEQPNDSRGEY